MDVEVAAGVQDAVVAGWRKGRVVAVEECGDRDWGGVVEDCLENLVDDFGGEFKEGKGLWGCCECGGGFVSAAEECWSSHCWEKVLLMA